MIYLLHIFLFAEAHNIYIFFATHPQNGFVILANARESRISNFDSRWILGMRTKYPLYDNAYLYSSNHLNKFLLVHRTLLYLYQRHAHLATGTFIFNGMQCMFAIPTRKFTSYWNSIYLLNTCNPTSHFSTVHPFF